MWEDGASMQMKSQNEQGPASDIIITLRRIGREDIDIDNKADIHRILFEDSYANDVVLACTACRSCSRCNMDARGADAVWPHFMDRERARSHVECVNLDHALSAISCTSDCTTSAAASPVVSPALSYTGATSTVVALGQIDHNNLWYSDSPTSAPMSSRPVRPSRMVRSSRVVHPPTSAVPVAGA